MSSLHWTEIEWLSDFAYARTTKNESSDGAPSKPRAFVLIMHTSAMPLDASFDPDEFHWYRCNGLEWNGFDVIAVALEAIRLIQLFRLAR